MGEITDKVKGTAKEATGKATGDDSMRREGKAEQMKGDIKGAGNEAQRSVSEKVDEARAKMDDDEQRRT